MLDQSRWHAQASGYFWVCRVTGGTRCVGSNLAVNMHTNAVADPGLVMITVNHGAAELVADLDRLANVVDCK